MGKLGHREPIGAVIFRTLAGAGSVGSDRGGDPARRASNVFSTLPGDSHARAQKIFGFFGSTPCLLQPVKGHLIGAGSGNVRAGGKEVRMGGPNLRRIVAQDSGGPQRIGHIVAPIRQVGTEPAVKNQHLVAHQEGVQARVA